MEEPECEMHGAKSLVFQAEDGNKYLCKVCTLKSKDQLKFYLQNQEKFENRFAIKNKDYESKQREYEGFCHVNNAFMSICESFNLDSDVFIKATTNKELLKKAAKEGISKMYSSITEKFEKTVDDLTEKTDKLDLTLKTAKDEITVIQTSLEEQINLLENRARLEDEFKVLFNKIDLKLRYSSIEKITDPNLKVSFISSCGNLNFRSGTSTIISARQNTGSYYCETSEEVLEGELFARLRINNITRKSDWSLNIGLLRANSQNHSSYYSDGVFFMCSGKITNQFSGNQGRTIFGQWNNGDEILIRRDSANSVFFGVNDESTLVQAYSNIAGQMRICIGFSSSMQGDIIEILEIEH